jgi:hypothetical protein
MSDCEMLGLNSASHDVRTPHPCTEENSRLRTVVTASCLRLYVFYAKVHQYIDLLRKMYGIRLSLFYLRFQSLRYSAQ